MLQVFGPSPAVSRDAHIHPNLARRQSSGCRFERTNRAMSGPNLTEFSAVRHSVGLVSLLAGGQISTCPGTSFASHLRLRRPHQRRTAPSLLTPSAEGHRIDFVRRIMKNLFRALCLWRCTGALENPPQRLQALPSAPVRWGVSGTTAWNRKGRRDQACTSHRCGSHIGQDERSETCALGRLPAPGGAMRRFGARDVGHLGGGRHY